MNGPAQHSLALGQQINSTLNDNEGMNETECNAQNDEEPDLTGGHATPHTHTQGKAKTDNVSQTKTKDGDLTSLFGLADGGKSSKDKLKRKGSRFGA